ncbi:polyketide synthase dehydratase domain-containing protein, partial [Streptomyces monashensis]|uniref:polyketide synthase dehydratase domain-containing protein n=1 Tax=Streptomyces monashensis TaxID=1678012 RepID=UPI001FEA85C0
MTVGPEIAEGRRSVAVYSRPENAGDDTPWRQHAAGELGPASARPDDTPETFTALAQWPVPGAERVDIEGLYGELAGRGLVYGPAFQG